MRVAAIYLVLILVSAVLGREVLAHHPLAHKANRSSRGVRSHQSSPRFHSLRIEMRPQCVDTVQVKVELSAHVFCFKPVPLEKYYKHIYAYEHSLACVHIWMDMYIFKLTNIGKQIIETTARNKNNRTHACFQNGPIGPKKLKGFDGTVRRHK